MAASSGKWSAKRRSERNDSFLGRFINFPPITHGFINVTCHNSSDQLQLSVIRALYKLNGSSKTRSISISGKVGSYEGEIGFETGVAEGAYFNYLDKAMVNRLNDCIMQNEQYEVLDFLVIVTYHYNRDGRKIPLNFDYHQLRFLFRNSGFEMRLFHSKGIRRIPFEELVNLILDIINGEMGRQSQKPLIVEESHVL